jgi:hypothetical protein
MADTKITSLLTPQVTTNPATDVLPIVNIADTSMASSGSTRKITVNQLLGAGGTATLASATITGDLTVDTSTLKVDSANNRVGIGTATPNWLLTASGSSPEFVMIDSGSNGTRLYTKTTNTAVFIGANYSTSAVPINFTLDGGSSNAMTLNSTGLGVGGSPAASKVEVYSSNTGTSGLAEANALKVENNNATVGNAAGLFLSQSGNAGCGVAAIATSRTGGSRASALSLYYYNQATSASPIEGARIDTSGNLLVGKSSAVATAVGIQFQPLGTSYHTLSASTNADATLLVYSTGAAAYRFYVGLGGTVFATNTTISAISDARLKENVQDLDVGLDAILALKPRKFDWKAGKGKDIKGDRGFIAQEFEQVFPNLIDEWKDEAPEGEAPYKSVRADLIPVLVKAVQELTARVQTLEAK